MATIDTHPSSPLLFAKTLTRYSLLLMLGILVGCGGGSNEDASVLDTPLEERGSADTNLKLSFRLLEQASVMNRAQMADQVLIYLNRWLGEKEAADDPGIGRARDLRALIDRLPTFMRNVEPGSGAELKPRGLGRMQFTLRDVFLLEELMTCRDIGRWVTTRKLEPQLEQWINKQDLKEAEQQTLRSAYLLFDWTYRNIQTDPIAPPADLTKPRPPWLPAGSIADSGPLRGVDGPGYMMRPVQAISYGHADHLSKSRAFIQIARQQDIDVVMLGFRTTEKEEDKPWLPGVRIGDRIYMFDMELGVPFPAENDQGICHLNQLIENPKLLDQLAVEDKGKRVPYRVTADQLSSVIALLDVAPSFMSRRMRILESGLTGEYRLRLAYNPLQRVSEMRSTKGVRQARLWHLPFQTVNYEMGLHLRRQADMNTELRMRRLFAPFRAHPKLPTARARHLSGRFLKESAAVGEKEDIGALSGYMECRYKQSKFDMIPTSPELQKEFGLQRQEGMTDNDWALRLEEFQLVYGRGKDCATYWLGLAHFDNGNFNTAREWFEERYLPPTSGPQQWTLGAQYNLARTFEAMGQAKKAKELYEKLGGTGDLIRARRLATVAAKQKSSPGKVKAAEKTPKRADAVKEGQAKSADEAKSPDKKKAPNKAKSVDGKKDKAG